MHTDQRYDNNDIVLIQFTLLCSMYTLCICWDKFYESKAVNTKFFSRLGNTTLFLKVICVIKNISYLLNYVNKLCFLGPHLVISPRRFFIVFMTHMAW